MGKGISVMVWVSFSGALGLGELVVINKDEDALRKGYSAASYLLILNNQIFKIYKPGLIFMQDNTLIHKARIIRNWFEEHVVEVIN